MAKLPVLDILECVKAIAKSQWGIIVDLSIVLNLQELVKVAHLDLKNY